MPFETFSKEEEAGNQQVRKATIFSVLGKFNFHDMQVSNKRHSAAELQNDAYSKCGRAEQNILDIQDASPYPQRAQKQGLINEEDDICDQHYALKWII
jgi:hypothetical protein